MAFYLRTNDAGSGNRYLRTNLAGAATLNTPTFSAITTSTATVSCTSDTAGGTIYLVVGTNSTTPSSAQIKAGQISTGAAALYAHNQTAVSGANAFAGVTGLSAGITYYAALIQNNGVDSNVVASSFVAASTPAITNINTTDIIVSAATGNVVNGTNLGAIVSGTLNYSTFSSAVTNVVAASTTVTFDAPTVSSTSLPFTDTNHTAIFLRITDGTNNAQRNLAATGGMAAQSGFTVYPISAATGQYGTDSAYHNVPSAPANNDQSVWPGTGTNGWTITPELSGGNATGRFNVSGGTGNSTVFTVYYRVETTGVWYSTAVTYTFNVSVNVVVSGVQANSAFSAPTPTPATNVTVTGVGATSFVGTASASGSGDAAVAITGVTAVSGLTAPTISIGNDITNLSVGAISAVGVPDVVIGGGVSSGTTSFRPTIIELLEEAWERATAGEELRTGYQLRTARRSFNFLTIDWQNRGYNFWTMRTETVPLIPGEAVVYLPLDTMDVADVTVAIDGVDRVLERITLPDYVGIPTKNNPGPPTQMQVMRTVSGVSLTLWPVPNSVYNLTVYSLRRIQDAGTGNTVADIPYRFLPALVAGLAYFIATKVPSAMARIPMLQAQYDDAFTAAADEDRDKGALFIAPRRMY